MVQMIWCVISNELFVDELQIGLYQEQNDKILQSKIVKYTKKNSLLSTL